VNIFYVKATSILPPRTLYPLDPHNTNEPSNPMTSLSLDWPSICRQSQHPFDNLISNCHEYHANGFVFHIPNCCDLTNMFVASRIHRPLVCYLLLKFQSIHQLIFVNRNKMQSLPIKLAKLKHLKQ